MQPLHKYFQLTIVLAKTKLLSLLYKVLTFYWMFHFPVGTSVSGLSGLYAVVMKAAGASRRVFQLLDRVSSMTKSGNKCPLGSVIQSAISCL